MAFKHTLSSKVDSAVSGPSLKSKLKERESNRWARGAKHMTILGLVSEGLPRVLDLSVIYLNMRS